MSLDDAVERVRPRRFIAAAVTLWVMAGLACAACAAAAVWTMGASTTEDGLRVLGAMIFGIVCAAVAALYGILGLWTFRADAGVRAVTNVLMGANAALLGLLCLLVGSWQGRWVLLACLALVLLVVVLVNSPPRRRPAPDQRTDAGAG